MPAQEELDLVLVLNSGKEMHSDKVFGHERPLSSLIALSNT